VESEGGNLFTVSYRDKDPQLAHDVVAALVNIFMERATGSNRADMQNAQKFLNQQIAGYEVKLREAEQRRADFRHKYMDILPLESNGGVSRLEGLRISIRELDAQQKDAVEKRNSLQEQERTTSPVINAGMVASDKGFQDSLAAAEAKLTELRLKYTDQPPRRR